MRRGQVTDKVTGQSIPQDAHIRLIADDEGALIDVSQQSGDDTSMISTPRDIGRFFTALFSGRLPPAIWLRQMMSVPDVRYADSSDPIPRIAL